MFYHISEFLPLQEGKVYRPSCSRTGRWISYSRDDFYEKIEETVSPVRKEIGVYLEQYAAFWLEQDGLQIGKIAFLFNNPAYPVFEWTKT